MNLDKIAPAVVAAVAEIGGVEKDSKNPAFKSRYASLEAVVDKAKPILAKHKLAFLQMPGALTEHGLNVTTMLLHESGQSIEGTLTIPLAKRDPQGAGSAITYACRYALMAILGMPPVDDDAEEAMGRGPLRDEPKRHQPKDEPRNTTQEPASKRWANYPIVEIGELAPAGVEANLWATAYARAGGGTMSYQHFWQNDTNQKEREALTPWHNSLKARAATMDSHPAVAAVNAAFPAQAAE